MKMKRLIKIAKVPFFALVIGAANSIAAQTIAEKKAGLNVAIGDDLTPEMKSSLNQVNNDVAKLHHELQGLYRHANKLYSKNAPAEFYEPILAKITKVKEQLTDLEGNWQQKAASGAREAGYALWNQPDTTIGQLVNDFGSFHFLYMAPPEIAKMKISLDSNLPIPRASWDEVLELVLNQSGIGIRQINPYVRELYMLRSDLSNPKIITSNRAELELFPSSERVVFVIAPEASETKRIWLFLEKFVNPNTTVLQMIGRDIVVVGNVGEVKDLLKIYDFVSTHRGDKEYKAVRVTKVDAEEMARILSALFESITEEPGEAPQPPMQPKAFPNSKDKGRLPPGASSSKPGQTTGRPEQPRGPAQIHGTASLRVIALNNIAQALFLVGTKEEIRKAEEIIRQVEGQVGDARRKEIFWYTVKHSDPEELAQILARIYFLMMRTGAHQPGFSEMISPEQLAREQAGMVQEKIVEAVEAMPKIPLGVINDTGFLSSANYLNNPEDRRKPRPPPNQGRDNFLVDLKTGAIIMVIEADLVAEMKDLIKRLDVPKRMVQIEVMLVEQVIANRTDIGLNLLKIGTMAAQTNATSLLFNVTGPIPGITDFIINRAPTGNIPAYDIAYHFLISRDDVRINASPSVLTMNETEAVIEFEEEIPVSVGTFIVPNSGTPTLQSSLARGRYGIKIDVIPTIHMHDRDSPYDDGIDYITLDSNVKFETVTSNVDNQPHVLRRTLTNQARIADGQTVIIGGFRRKDSQDVVQAVPFLGEIPGFGKLFSNTSLRDTSVETFLFLTAKIVFEPLDDLEAIKMQEMARRPGDLPYFMQALREAKETEENRYLNQTMQMLFGREPERYVDKEACTEERCEYDGR